MKDRLQIPLDSLNILNNDLHLLESKIDSIIKVNNELRMHENYFSDIISSQMNWFAILFVTTFGILGLAYWLGIFKYFQNKFSKTDSEIKSLRNSLISRITQKDKQNKNKLEANYTLLVEKIESLEKLQTKLNTQKYKTLSEDIIHLEKKISELLSKNEIELKQIITKQSEDFDKNKQQLLTKLWDANFDTKRSLFLYNYEKKNYNNALDYIYPILEMIVNNNVNFDSTPFLNAAEVCVENLDINEAFKEEFDDSIKSLIKLEDKEEDDNVKKRINKLRLLLNKKFYIDVEIEDKE